MGVEIAAVVHEGVIGVSDEDAAVIHGIAFAQGVVVDALEADDGDGLAIEDPVIEVDGVGTHFVDHAATLPLDQAPVGDVGGIFAGFGDAANRRGRS